MEFHPDKNNTSKASEAFKHVNKAYKCLIDDNKREYYDSTGKEEEVIINMEHIFTKDTLIIVFLSVLHGTVFSPGHNLYSFFSPSTQIFGSYNKILKYVPSFLLIFLMFSSLYMQLTQPSTQYSNSDLQKTQDTFLNPSLILEYSTIPEEFKKYHNQDLENLWKDCENSESLKNYFLQWANKTSGFTSKMLANYAETINLSSCFYLDQLLLYNLNRI